MSRYNYSRRPTIAVAIGSVTVGAGHPIALQSMTNTPTMDTAASAEQCLRLAEAGADIVRLTAQTPKHAENLANIHREVRAAGVDTPLVADIHFNPEAAFAAARHVEKVRINPGNFVDPGRTFVKLEYTDEEYAAEIGRIRAKLVPLLDICRERGTSLRIGVNHGSLSDRIMSRYGDTPAGMVESAMEFLRICRSEGFDRVVISIKASNVVVMTQTVRLLVRAMEAEDMAYPLHLGVTEAGDGEDARVKSAVGIGSLLADGIGDTIRVSLTADPVREVYAARDILKAAGLRHDGVNIVACPTCGRTRIDLIGLANRVEEALKNCKKPITVAVMGCVVNGPGEAREADVGIAGGDGVGMLFAKGEMIQKLPYDELLPALLSYIDTL